MDFDSLLSSIDTASPFVRVSIDSDRINTTITSILQALSTLKSSVHSLSAQVAEKDAQILALKGAQSDAMNQLASLDSLFASQRDKLSTQGDVIHQHTAQIKDLNERLKAQENRKVDLSHIQRDIDGLRASLNESLQSSSKNAQLIKSCHEKVETTSAVAIGAQSSIKTLFTTLQLPETSAIDAIERDSHDQKTTFRRDLLLELPAFAFLRTALADGMRTCQQNLQSESTDIRAWVTGEHAALRSALSDKVDQRQFQPVAQRLDELNKTNLTLSSRLERVAKEQDLFVKKDHHREAIDHLENSKADRSSLQGFASAEELRSLQDRLDLLSQHLDRSLAQMTVDLKGVVSRAPVGRDNAATADDLLALIKRVSSLEGEARRLEEVKADKSSLVELQQWIEGVMKDRTTNRPTSASDFLLGTPRKKGSLTPIQRPGSARTIPDDSRPNSELYFTSIPRQRSGSPSRDRSPKQGTQRLFDCDGQLTQASLSAKHVPAAEHYENMRRVAAGEEHIPHDHKKHIIFDGQSN